MGAGRIQLDLSAGPLFPEDVAVARVEGREGLSEPYAFAVDFTPRSGEALDLEELIGREAELTLRRNTGEERVVHGECHRVELTGVAAGVPSYRVTIRPRLSRLELVTQSRIFQGKSVPQIVDAVLTKARVAHRSALSGSYPAREYTTQYRESDLAFVSRLLEEEGIWYRFEHVPGGSPGLRARGREVRRDAREGAASRGSTRRGRTGRSERRRCRGSEGSRRRASWDPPGKRCTSIGGAGSRSSSTGTVRGRRTTGRAAG